MSLISFIRNRHKLSRTSLTRVSIGDAIILLLDKKALEEISISDICKRAGVSRMTFYKYYNSKHDALQDYLAEMIYQYVQNPLSGKAFGSYEHILFTLSFFREYKSYILGLSKCQHYDILINGVNTFLEDNFKNEFNTSIYNMYFYAGAILNTYIKWLENGEVEPIEEIATVISRLKPI